METIGREGKMAQISKEQIIELYQEFKIFYFSKKNSFNRLVESDISNSIKNKLKSYEQWNDASLDMYIRALIKMVKGEQQTRSISQFAKDYFLETLCKDFDDIICKNAKSTIVQHSEYYSKIVAKDTPNSKNNLDRIIRVKKQFNELIYSKFDSIKNIILYGVPGVGKTHNTHKLISLIESGVNEKEIFQMIEENLLNDGIKANQVLENIENRVRFITFHQSYSYEDFIEGFKPTEDGGVKRQDGIFKEIVEDAKKDSEKNYYLIIDEINRGNISKIFGELITLIEEDKRDKYEVTLPYSKEKFSVPSNLYIIATMNSTDKSIATIDIALRRRFTFLKMKPNESLVSYQNARNLMSELNEFIGNILGEDYKLGHSYFMSVQNDADLEFVKEYKIQALLEEYFYADETNSSKVLEILKSNNREEKDD